MTELALPRARARRRPRKPWSPRTRMFFACFCVMVLSSVQKALELAVGVRWLTLLWGRGAPTNGWDAAGLGGGMAMACLYWALFLASREGDRR